VHAAITQSRSESVTTCSPALPARTARRQS
jgi:hypothetical protein